MLSTEESAGTLLALEARTVDTYSPAMHNNKGYRGVVLFFEVTVDDAGASVVPYIQMYNPTARAWEAYLTGTAKDAVASTQWMIYPLDNLLAVIVLADESAAPLPTLWRLFMDVADANALTYSVGYQYLP